MHPYRCNVCNKSFVFERGLKHHTIIHTEERPYHCDVCNMSFRYLKDLKVHMYRHNEYPYSCILCGEGFSCQSTLTKHERVHTGERPCICNVCGNSFAQSSALQTHQLVHTGECPYVCDVCTESFREKSVLNAHQFIHTKERPFVCDACNKSSDLRNMLADIFPCSVWNVCSAVVCANKNMWHSLQTKLSQVSFCWTRCQDIWDTV